MRPTGRRLIASRRLNQWTDVGVLAALALFASWVQAIVIALSTDVVTDLDPQRPTLYYYAHGFALLAVMASGLLAAWRQRLRILTLSGRLALLVLAGCAAGWGVASYSVDEWFSSTVFGATGPFVWLTLIFVLVGTDRRVWSMIDPVIRLLAYATSVLALWSLSNEESVYYSGQLSRQTQYSILLMWLGGWTLLTATRLRGWRLAARAAPFFTLLLSAIYSQARSWTALTMLVGLAFVILTVRERRSVLAGVRLAIVVVGLSLAAAGLIYDTVLKPGVEGLVGRLYDDTRSGQYVEFFSSVPPSDLLLGRGPKGSWYWPGVGDYQFFDNGFLWTAFIGGVPTLVSYFAFVIWPGIRGLRAANFHGRDAAAVVLVLLWGFALAGLSTYTLPSVSISSYLASLWAGRCHLIMAERATRTREHSINGETEFRESVRRV